MGAGVHGLNHLALMSDTDNDDNLSGSTMVGDTKVIVDSSKFSIG